MACRLRSDEAHLNQNPIICPSRQEGEAYDDTRGIPESDGWGDEGVGSYGAHFASIPDPDQSVEAKSMG